MKWLALLLCLCPTFALALTPGQQTSLAPYDLPTAAIEQQIVSGCGRPVGAYEDGIYYYTRSVFDRYAVWSGLIALHDWNAADLCSALIDFANPQPPVQTANFTGSLGSGVTVGDVLSVYSIKYGTIAVGSIVIGAGVTVNTVVNRQLTLSSCKAASIQCWGVSQFSVTAQEVMTTVQGASGSSLLAAGSVSFNPFASIQGDAATGFLQGALWPTVSPSQTNGLGTCFMMPSPVAGQANAIFGLSGQTGSLLFEGQNTSGNLIARLDSSASPSGAGSTQAGIICADAAAGSTTETKYFNGAAVATLTGRVGEAPTSNNYVLLGNASGSPLFSSDPDVYHTIQPHESPAWYANEYTAMVQAGTRTGAWSPLPSGPTCNGGATPCNAWNSYATSPTITPSTLTITYSGGCPASNSDPNFPAYPAQSTVNHGCTSTAWAPPGTGHGNIWLPPQDWGCTTNTPGSALSCSLEGHANTPNPIDGAPTNNCSGCDNNVIRLGFANVPDSMSAFEALIEWTTNQSYAPVDVYGHAIPVFTNATFLSAVAAGCVPEGAGCLSLVTGQYTNNGLFDVPSTPFVAAITTTTTVGDTLNVTVAGVGYLYAGQTVNAGFSSCNPFISANANSGGTGTYPLQWPTGCVPAVAASASLTATPAEIAVLSQHRAADTQSGTNTFLLEGDFERADGCNGGLPFNFTAAQICFSNYMDSLNSIAVAASPQYQWVVRVDEFCNSSACANAFYSGVGPISIQHILGLSNVKLFDLFGWAQNQQHNVITSLNAELAIANGGSAPTGCTSFFNKIGIRLQLSNLAVSDWQNVYSNFIIGDCINYLEPWPNGGQLGGLKCIGAEVVQNPAKYGSGFGYITVCP